jgi:hypothetical protein
MDLIIKVNYAYTENLDREEEEMLEEEEKHLEKNRKFNEK